MQLTWRLFLIDSTLQLGRSVFLNTTEITSCSGLPLQQAGSTYMTAVSRMAVSIPLLIRSISTELTCPNKTKQKEYQRKQTKNHGRWVHLRRECVCLEVTENVGDKLQNAYSTVYMISVYRVLFVNRNSDRCYSYNSRRVRFHI